MRTIVLLLASLLPLAVPASTGLTRSDVHAVKTGLGKALRSTAVRAFGPMQSTPPRDGSRVVCGLVTLGKDRAATPYTGDLSLSTAAPTFTVRLVGLSPRDDLTVRTLCSFEGIELN
jgi:hypothetical protein